MGDSSFVSKIVMTTQGCADTHDRYGIYRTNPRKNRKRMNLVGKEGACVRVCVCVEALLDN